MGVNALNAFQFSLSGARDVQFRMQDLPGRLQKKGLRRAARVAMKIVQNAARVQAQQFDDPASERQIWKLIQIREGRRLKDGIVMRVGVAGGARSSPSKSHPWYWRLIELGTETTPARPFMRPALENNAQAVGDRLARELSAELDILAATER